MPVLRGWRALLIPSFFLLTGCGLSQTVSDGAVDVTNAIFYKKIKVLHLDFTPRKAANADGDQIPLATMMRVYQLKDSKALESANYFSLLHDGDKVLKEDLLESKSLLVMPQGSVSLNMPMHVDAKFVAVVALFNRPDLTDNRWRLLLTRSDLDPDYPRVVELADSTLSILPVKEK